MPQKKSMDPKNRSVQWPRQKYKNTLQWDWISHQRNLRRSVDALIKGFCIEHGSKEDATDVILNEAINYKKSSINMSTMNHKINNHNNKHHTKKPRRTKNSQSHSLKHRMTALSKLKGK